MTIFVLGHDFEPFLLLIQDIKLVPFDSSTWKHPTNVWAKKGYKHGENCVKNE